MPALTLDAAIIHMNRADARGNGQFLGPDPYFDDLFCLAAEQRFMSCERIVETAELTKEGVVPHPEDQPADGRRGHRDPQRRALHHLHPGLRARREVPDARTRRPRPIPKRGSAFRQRFLAGDEAAYQQAVSAFAQEVPA